MRKFAPQVEGMLFKMLECSLKDILKIMFLNVLRNKVWIEILRQELKIIIEMKNSVNGLNIG